MKQCIREELIYLLKSKIVIGFTLVSVLFSIVFLYTNYLEAANVVDNYFSFSEDISEGVNVIFANEGEGIDEITTDEELQYYKEIAEMKLYSVSPQYTIEFVLEGICSLAFFLFAIYAVIWALYDNNNNTFRLKAVRYKRSDILFAKHIAMVIGMVIIVVLTTVIVYIGNSIYYKKFLRSIHNADGLSIEEYGASSPFLFRMFVTLIIVLIASEVGFAIATLIKKSVVSYFVVIAYSFFIPSLGKYDPRSCISALMYEHFEYYGSISLEEPALESVGAALIILLGIFVVCYGMNYFIYLNRSAYK